MISEKLKETGWEFSADDSFADQQLKSSLFASAANAEDPEAVAFAKEAFAKFIAGDKKAIHPNLRASIFNTNAKYGDEKHLTNCTTSTETHCQLKKKLLL